MRFFLLLGGITSFLTVQTKMCTNFRLSGSKSKCCVEKRWPPTWVSVSGVDIDKSIEWCWICLGHRSTYKGAEAALLGSAFRVKYALYLLWMINQLTRDASKPRRKAYDWVCWANVILAKDSKKVVSSLTDEDLANIQKLSKDPQIVDRIVASIH